MANIYRVCNGVCNDVFKYDFSFVANCNSYIKLTGYDTIYCYSLTGQTIWDFRDRSVLRKGKGIALDKNSNVFVAGMETFS
jgi:hypothetical protein